MSGEEEGDWIGMSAEEEVDWIGMSSSLLAFALPIC